MNRMTPLLILSIAICLSSNRAIAQVRLQKARAQQNEDDIIVSIGDQELLRYHKILEPSPAGMDPIYGRSGYIHPVRTPGGLIVTGDFAPDHPHQHALFGAWVKTEFNGHPVDFWNLHAGTGRVVHRRVDSLSNDETGARFTVEHRYQDLADADHPVDVLVETWTLHAHHQTGPHYVFDIEIQQHCATEQALKLPPYHYGGMALRGSNQWYHEDAVGCDFLTSAGKRREDGNHTDARWVDMSGKVDGKPAGITMLSHPTNFRAPQPVRLHPSKPYFCFTPMVHEGFEITPQKPYRARYRYLVHDGPPVAKQIDEEWTEFADES